MPDLPASTRLSRFRGLNPAALTGVLAGASSPRPAIPGWEVGEPLGEGGLGTVWKATRISDGTVAAIKVPRTEDISLIERLEAEAGALRALEHPHIISLLETGPLENGSLYLAMEYVDGSPLSHIIPAGGLPAVRAYALFRQIAEAVAHAHSRGILHRDLKPGNILIAADGTVRVADFGLAQSVAGRVLRLSITFTGQVAGTAEYLPPEAYRPGYEASASTDLYALGVILYELLTGSPPRGAWPRVSSQKADVDIRIDMLLRRALDPDPARRFSSVAAVLEEFDRILRSPPRFSGSPRVTRAIRFMDFLWTVGGLFLLLASFGVLARVEKYGFGLPVDLVGTETERIGTYQAIIILLTVFAPMGLWQLYRLWRFRRVPLREALPAPLGLRIGTNRTAALAVALTQFLCVIAPGVFGAWSWREKCQTWLQPDDFPWKQGLVVTLGYRGRTAHDPWDWPQPGQSYSLRERAGWLTDPLSQDIDHTNYWPGFIPRYIASLTLFYTATVAFTLLSGCARWWRFRQWRQPLLLCGLLLLSLRTAQADIAAWKRIRQREMDTANLRDLYQDRQLRQLDALLASISRGQTPQPDTLYHFAYPVTVGGQSCTAETLPAAMKALAASFTGPHRSLRSIRSRFNPGAAPDQFRFVLALEDCTDPPGGPATGAVTLIGCYGTCEARAAGGRVLLAGFHTSSLPLWTAEPRPLLPEEAAAWARAFAAALSTPLAPGQPDPLDALFLPVLLTESPRYASAPPFQIQPVTRAEVLAPLYALRVRGPLPVQISPPGPAESQPGARQRITFAIGTGADLVQWQADLVHTSGRWQCVFLRL